MMILGGVNRPGAVPAFLRGPAVLPGLDMKPFLQFPVDSPHPGTMGLFHHFSTMDPVQKAVLSHTFGPAALKTKRPIISCNVCQIRFNSESQAEAHYKGNRHARRVKGIETSKTGRTPEGDRTQPPTLASPLTPGPSPCSPEPEPSRQDDALPAPMCTEPPPPPAASPQPTPPLPAGDPPLLPLVPSGSPGPGGAPGDPEEPSPVPSLASGDSEDDKARKLLYCALCKVAVNSLSQLDAHNKGTKHKTIQEARSGLGPIKAYPRLGPRVLTEGGGPASDANTEERTFHCEICNVRVNSELQLKQHISSRRHRDGVAGKPNPLLTRHKKLREFLPPLTFSKDLPKNLGAGLLPNPLAVAAAMAAAASSNQLAQIRAACPGAHPHPHPHPLPHHPHHHPHLLQGPALSLLRPAPGPMRTTHGPILFAPY